MAGGSDKKSLASIREAFFLLSRAAIAYVTGGQAFLLAGEADASKMLAVPVGRVYFNDTQYFSDVPKAAWNFYIGGYQPAQKWLKDRKNRTLSFDDVAHYQKIVVALTETARIMTEIDENELVN